MGDSLNKGKAQQNVELCVTLVKYMFGSPAGMSQLIKYFETQSRQLDQQTVHLAPASFNPEFESLIRFKGVPILPPAITSSRRNELQQHKKDAVLLEKRLKARHHQTQVDTYHSQGGPVESTFRPTARQLNFDVDVQHENSPSSILQDRLASTSSLNTYAIAEPEIVTEDFGLQTIDSVSSEFTTLDESSIPKVFNGLVLTSLKEQKISYDLDRLSKALNVQELTSTSGSDLSDFIPKSANQNCEQISFPKDGNNGEEQTVSFCHESQDTVVEVSPGDNTSTSGFVENPHLEHTHSSPCSSPGYGSANTSTTIDSQRSSRSSPKSLKGAVHFASFVTEYNTRISQAFDKPTVITKKITVDDVHSCSGGHSDHVVEPVIGHLSNSRHKHALDMNLPDPQDSDKQLNIPFQTYCNSDTLYANKENESSGLSKYSSHAIRKLRKNSHGEKKVICSEAKDLPHSGDKPHVCEQSLPVLAFNVVHQAGSDVETPGLHFNVNPEPHSHPSKSVSTSATALTDNRHTSVSYSQGSSASNSFTVTSESSSSTIKDDTPLQNGNILSNCIKGTKDTEYCDNTMQSSSERTNSDEIDRKEGNTPKTNCISETTTTLQESVNAQSPYQTLIRRGSYTLSEPSPALLRAKSKLEAEKKSKEQSELGQQSKQQKESNRKPLTTKQSSLKVSAAINPSGSSIPSHSEREGKAEHISKYLSQVQFQNSMNFSWDANQPVLESEIKSLSDEIHEKDLDTTVSVLEVLKSIAESQGSIETMTVEDLLSLHQQQMGQKRQELIRQQQQDMEELFIQQRREVMLLEAEIKAAKQLEKDQQEFLIQNAPENIKVRARNHEEEYSPEQSYDDVQQTVNVFKGQTYVKSQSVPSLHTKAASTENIPLMRTKPTDNVHMSKKFQHLKNSSFQSLAKSKLTPDLSQSPDLSPSQLSPKNHRPLVFRSPLKSTISHLYEDIVYNPSQANLPEMKYKFDKVSAAAKGFLTRCLFRSDKVQELIKTIHDTREFAYNFQTETPIKKGVFTTQDTALLERIIAQLQAALLDIHEIFFEIPVSERMALIEQTRLKENEKKIKASSDSTRESGPKISQATLKALERKRKAREAETMALISSSRPKTAPTTTNNKLSSQTDMSGPLKRHFGFLISRALKPLTSHTQLARSETSRSEKERPRTAPEKPLTKPKRITATLIKPGPSNLTESNKDCNKDSTVSSGINNQGTNSNKPVIKSKVATNKTALSQPPKSWR
ncbi:uncharacterized protein LOC106054138 isoform X2 [Biomphalaria glabrata]|uniref:Uncharacterized protein LOC106054138 isoform X2 n=1 Tax=Biomphalaria glabrata TaxID=6526 RepID=A0A9U8DXH2_BIOGL|nr:uncharacterized protein LOC106054138 isoform X2 [Biomphalaria glabrata]